MSYRKNQYDRLKSDTTTELLKASGRRPQFHALWHLAQLGVVKDTKTFDSEYWSAVKRSIEENDVPPVRVAVIDTMPAFNHPNLRDVIDTEKLRDFTTPDKPKSYDDLLRPVTQNTAFGAHGTAVAGLIAGRPRDKVVLQGPQNFVGDLGANSYLGEELPNPDEIALPYCGINPYAKIIPLVLSSAPDPAMIQKALEYAINLAKKKEVDIVVIADSWDRDGTPYTDSPRPDATRDEIALSYGSVIKKPSLHQKTSKPPWDTVDETLEHLCRLTFVFCAAGNEPRSDQADKGALVYPASMSTAAKGPWAVGACDFEGKDLTYTPNSVEVRKAGHRLITTLSSEHPRLDEASQRLDPWGKQDEELDVPPWPFQRGWPAQDIVSTDVPGPAGYNPSPYDFVPADNTVERGSEAVDTHLEIASLFCRFSGTSAATAIAAGLVSLALAYKWATGSKDSSKDVPYPGPHSEREELFTLDQAILLVNMKTPSSHEHKDR